MRMCILITLFFPLVWIGLLWVPCTTWTIPGSYMVGVGRGSVAFGANYPLNATRWEIVTDSTARGFRFLAWPSQMNAYNSPFQILPVWMFAALPFSAAALIAGRQLRRHRQGDCWKCGYPRPVRTSICPECGTVLNPTNEAVAPE